MRLKKPNPLYTVDTSSPLKPRLPPCHISHPCMHASISLNLGASNILIRTHTALFGPLRRRVASNEQYTSSLCLQGSRVERMGLALLL